MDYAANAINAGYQKQQYVGGSALGGALGVTAVAVPKQPTVASALGRIEGLNARLAQVATQLAAISDAVGGPRPVNGVGGDAPAPSGMVYRLNDSAEASHRQISEIEDLIGAIGRALG